ncbi:MAG TPA: o-succinylbenzoate synthase [Actinomycetota bacterium]|nr:o-succinylbenzoate synthase [Actinomycetota bacterium]
MPAGTRLEALELRRIAVPMKTPFRTSFGTQQDRDILLVKAITSEGEGWGECVAMSSPVYSSEYIDGAQQVIKSFLAPLLFAERSIDVPRVADVLMSIKGHRMAKAAVEMAILDAELRGAGRSFAHFLGGVRDFVDTGVSVGIHDDIGELLDTVAGYVEEGYMRIKLKIEPGSDIDHVRAVREKFGPDLLLQVDANTAYQLSDAEHLAQLDEYNLLLIEQPLPEEEVRAHAELAAKVSTPICLDESITSTQAATDAIALGACSIINIKAGRVGGYLEAKNIHDYCSSVGVPVWCGGMLETGIGRAANVALASLPNFTLPGDTSASDRYWATDITEPFVLEDGRVRVPTGPGLGVEPIPEILEEVTTAIETIRVS